MYLLAIETATDACSCALLDDRGGSEPAERFEFAPRGHAELLLGMVEALLAEAGIGYPALDALAFGRGPGSFTGVRIAAGVVQGLAFGLDLPVVPVSTLDALAHGAARVSGRPRIAAGLDARMGELYWTAAVIDAPGALANAVGESLVTAAEAEIPDGDDWFGAGPAWHAAGETLARRFGSRLAGVDATLLPRARDVAALAAPAYARGEAVAAERALPVYLRDRVAVPGCRAPG